MMMREFTDMQLAHGLARIGLGINIALHGWTRLPQAHEFANSMLAKFSGSILPGPMVQLTAYGIITAESIVGAMLLLGWKMRAALVAGHLLMFTLLFGTCLLQDWGTAGSQLVYLAFFSVLLATMRHRALCLDPLPDSAPAGPG